MRKILFFDVETNGLPKAYNASYTDVDNWPRVIQLAWALFSETGELIRSQCALIVPNGWRVPTDKFWTDNGFSQAKSEAEGIRIEAVLEDFMSTVMEADFLAAHNLNFDHHIVWAEIIRAGRVPRSGMNKICTMQKSTNVCKLPKAKGGGYKWPKLEELHQFLFGQSFDGAHDALADVHAGARCLFELIKRGHISLTENASA